MAVTSHQEFNKELIASVGKKDTFQIMLDKAFDKAEKNLRLSSTRQSGPSEANNAQRVCQEVWLQTADADRSECRQNYSRIAQAN